MCLYLLLSLQRYTPTHINTHTPTQIQAHRQTHTYTHTHKHTRMHTHANTQTPRSAQTQTHIRNVRTHINKHTHTYTHSQQTHTLRGAHSVLLSYYRTCAFKGHIVPSCVFSKDMPSSLLLLSSLPSSPHLHAHLFVLSSLLFPSLLSSSHSEAHVTSRTL